MKCGAKFYDLNKDPAVCPKCGTPMQASAITRVAAPVVARARPQPEEEAEVEPVGPEMVSLEDVAADEAGKDAATDEDVDLAEDVTAPDDDTFLEEEEEGGDDVADLIDGDIEDDEEA